MKQFLSVRALFCSLWLFVFGTLNANAAIKNWTNSLGGNYFDPSGWSPNGVPGANDLVTITNSGTYTVVAPTGTVASVNFVIGGGIGKQTFVYGTTASFQFLVTNSFVRINGVLVVTNAGLTGTLTVNPGAELQFNSAGLYLYQLSLTNFGTVSWLQGGLTIGGSNTNISYFDNFGIWQISSDATMQSGGGGNSQFFNAGIVRKNSGTGNSTLGVDFHNLPSGITEVTTGELRLSSPTTNFLAGSFTATSPGVMRFFGNCTDSGGAASGTGSFQYQGGNFYLRTNPIPGITLVTGNVYITGTNIFQNAGAITNLTLDGATLNGSNLVTGTLTFNSGGFPGPLIVMPSGQVNLAGTGSAILLYSSTLINQGTVNWSGGLSVGGTPPNVISNGGTWNMTGNGAMSHGGGLDAVFTNAGTVQKIGGTGNSDFSGLTTFVNLPSGIIIASTGTLQMPFSYTNAAGEMRLAGGTLFASGTLGMTGGTLDGSGIINSPADFDGGTVAPSPGPNVIQFKSSLSLGTNVILSLDGTGTVPGISYDQLSVAGAVAINNCTLQVTSLPSVPVGTTFVIVTNTTPSGTTGIFNGLPENAPLTISGQPFRIHYGGGNGNDIILVRDSGLDGGPLLSSGGYSNTVYRLIGAGSVSTIYSIQGSTNFIQWTNLGLATGDVSGNFKFTDTNANKFRYRFYRTTN